MEVRNYKLKCTVCFTFYRIVAMQHFIYWVILNVIPNIKSICWKEYEPIKWKICLIFLFVLDMYDSPAP